MLERQCVVGVSRRSFLGVIGASAAGSLAGVALAPPARAASQWDAAGVISRSSPRTLAQVGGGGLVRPGFPVEYVGVRWTGGDGGRVRFIDGAGQASGWYEVACGCTAGRQDADAALGVGSALVTAPPGAVGYETVLPPGARTVALNATAGPPGQVALSERDQRTTLAGCRYLSRARWGADESLRFDETGAERYPQTYWPVQTITVHHTATGNDDPDPAARVCAIYRFQTVDEDFGDIGYHFLIDEAGRIYEGRYSGTDPLPGFDPAGRMVNAAHVAGFNAGNVGIALLGTFVDRPPTDQARQTLTLLLAAITGRLGLDPLGTVDYVNPISGAAKTVAAIPGHRDWAPTECPGGALYAMLPAIRADVSRLVDKARTIARPTLG